MDALQSTGIDRIDVPYYDPESLLATMETLRQEAADYQAQLQAATFAEQGWSWDDATQQWVHDTQKDEAGETSTGEAVQWDDAGEKVAAAGAEPPVPGEEEPPVPGVDEALLPPGVDPAPVQAADAPQVDISDEIAAFYSDADVTKQAAAGGDVSAEAVTAAAGEEQVSTAPAVTSETADSGETAKLDEA